MWSHLHLLAIPPSIGRGKYGAFLWSKAQKGWREAPPGQTLWQVYGADPAVWPLWGAVATGAVLLVYAGARIFTTHTDLTFNKRLRATHDHEGLVEHRTKAHNERIGMRKLTNVSRRGKRMVDCEYKSFEYKHGVRVWSACTSEYKNTHSERIGMRNLANVSIGF